MASYIPIRDDAGLRSLSVTERDFIRACALKTPTAVRTDGRNWNQVRHQRLQLLRWENGASCTLQWGTGTRVSATCAAELIPPAPDRPSEGMLTFSVELSPAASTSYRMAAPATTASGPQSSSSRGLPPDEEQKLTSNRILRCLERILITGGALDTEALCVTPEQWVWKLSVTVTVLDAGGNLLDACALACMAALRHYRKPHVQLNNNGAEGSSTNGSTTPTLIPSHLKEPTPLPLHHTPLCISFALIPVEDAMRSTSSDPQVAALVDPNQREELVMTGVLTIAMNVHAEVCLLDYGGGCELQPDKLRECWTLATSCIQQLCQSLEKSLEQADGQAMQERLSRLQQQSSSSDAVVLPPTVGDSDLAGVPFFHSADGTDEVLHVPEGDANADQAANLQAENQAEEAYRRQALDYNLGHVTQKIREDDEKATDASKDPQKQASSLLKAMLQSVQGLSSASAKERVYAQMDSIAKATKEEVSDDAMQVDEEEKPKAALSKPKKPVQPATRKSQRVSTAMDDSDDEEETTVQLRTEFEEVTPVAKASESNAEPMDEDDNVDDLAAAIKKKKKKPKKFKK